METSISTLLSIGLLWWLFFWVYRDYRLDFCRQKLFALRDELFDVAAEHGVDFDSPSYGILRSTINGFIQYSHQFGFFNIIAMMLSTRDKTFQAYIERVEDDWESGLESIPSEVREKFLDIKERVHLELAEQVVFTSAVLAFTCIGLLLACCLYWVKNSAQNAIRSVLRGTTMRSVTSRMDGAALMVRDSSVLAT